MYTVDDIRNITFTKTLGGYKTAEVDDFIDICADTVEDLTRQNEDLKKKMELLANKVVEYRNDEDSIRTALLSAQRMGDTVLREANHKATLILEDAKIKAEKAEELAKQQIKEQLDELERIKKLVSDFKGQILGVYREHLSMIDVLPEYKEPEKEEEEVAEEVAQPVEEIAPAEEKQEAPVVESVEETETQETVEEAFEDVEAEEEVPVLFTGEEMEETVENNRFSDLKFGADYSIADDVDDEDDKKRSKRRLF